MKRMLALILALAMLLPSMTVFAAKEPAQPKLIPQSAYDAVSADIWQDIAALEASAIPAKRAKTATASDYSALTQQVIELVLASDTYVEGSLNRNGNFFTWETTQGVVCGYSPRLRARLRAAAIPNADPEALAGVETVSYADKGGAPTSTGVALIEPYYGLDSSFTKQYQNEAAAIAQASGGTYTAYTTTAATVDAVADAIENNAVVIFDSHGDTDYMNENDEEDFVSRANTSYICLQSGDGLTQEDMKSTRGTYGEYQHAYYAGYGDGGMRFYCVDGTVIANHMEKDAPNSLLWMAICLGMATDGLQAPLRVKGVEVAYGYSQSVTFNYDYEWEEVFYDNLCSGKTVAQSIAAMKTAVGSWDYCRDSQCNTIAKARANYCAFPIVVSSEDTYPGQGNVDNLQTVNSTWVLKAAATEHTPSAVAAKPASCTEPGNIAYWYCEHCEKYFSDAACSQEITLAATVLPVTQHSYSYTLASAPSFAAQGALTGTCGVCSGTTAVTLPRLNTTDYTHSVVNAASCGQTGLERYTWNNTAYGSFAFDVVTGALTHSWGAGLVTTEPSSSEAGVRTYTCSLCGETRTEPISPTGEEEETPCDGGADCPGGKFTDMPAADNWAHAGIDFALENGLFGGMGETIFAPDANMTRAMLVTVLWRLDGRSEPTQSNPFTDVPDNVWYTQAVIWAAENGVVTGVGENKFDPEGNVTREQIAAIMFRYAGMKGYDTTARADLSAYPDSGAVSAWAQEALSWANAERLITGSDGSLLPQGNATRAQVAAILMRYVQNIVN